METKKKISTKPRIDIFNILIDPVTMKDAVNIVMGWVSEAEKHCKFVITPNVDHIVQVQKNIALQHAYNKAALVVTDGKPVVWAANLLGVDIPETVPGSDLVPEIFNYANVNKKPIKVFLLGAMPGVADQAKENINQQWPIVNIVGTLSPDFGFDKCEKESMTICEIINKSSADLLLIGLGAPKQELWINQYAKDISVKAALCIGATIDFLANEKPRAPIWMRRCGLEWLHRVISEPKRLAKRYMIDAVVFPQLVFKEWRSTHRH